jgi:hypothetical protein
VLGDQGGAVRQEDPRRVVPAQAEGEVGVGGGLALQHQQRARSDRGAGGDRIGPRVVVVLDHEPAQVERDRAGVHQLDPVGVVAVGLDLVDHQRADRRIGGVAGVGGHRAGRGDGEEQGSGGEGRGERPRETSEGVHAETFPGM